jgi:hypothetical protein
VVGSTGCDGATRPARRLQEVRRYTGAAQTTGGGATDCDAERGRWAAPKKLPTGTNCEA